MNTYKGNAPVTYVRPFLKDPDAVLLLLAEGVDWERREDAPRCECFMSDFDRPYTYGRGRGRRTYQPKPFHPVVRVVRAALEELTGFSYEVCFLNKYLGQHDHLGWHADDSPEMDDARPIASVSLGAAREIQFRRKVAADRPRSGEVLFPPESLVLQHGSLCLMAPGMQDEWEHRIPKTRGVVGERVSLVFRGYVEPPVIPS